LRPNAAYAASIVSIADIVLPPDDERVIATPANGGTIRTVPSRQAPSA
jgi:hypothetical protein